MITFCGGSEWPTMRCVLSRRSGSMWRRCHPCAHPPTMLCCVVHAGPMSKCCIIPDVQHNQPPLMPGYRLVPTVRNGPRVLSHAGTTADSEFDGELYKRLIGAGLAANVVEPLVPPDRRYRPVLREYQRRAYHVRMVHRSVDGCKEQPFWKAELLVYAQPPSSGGVHSGPTVRGLPVTGSH